MNHPTEFQLSYPLSVTRKFWKKIISNTIIFFVFAVICGIFIGGVLLSNPQLTNDTGFAGRSVLWTIIFFAFFVLTYAWYVSVYIKRYYYEAGESFLSIQKGVFAPTEIHVQYTKIQDVYVDQDILDRILGIYDVHIASATASSGIEAHIDGVSPDVAEKLKNLLLSTISGSFDRSNKGGTINNDKTQKQSIEVSMSKFDGNVSNQNYPISLRWIFSSGISKFFLSIFYAFIISAVYLEDKHDEIAVYFVIIIAIIIFILQIGWSLIWRLTYKFQFLEESIIMKSGVISRQEKHMPYRSIQNATLNQGVIERMLGISTVIIENAAQQVVGHGRYKRLQQSAVVIPGQPIAKGQELIDVINSITKSQSQTSKMGI